jgi:hypothetical protein
MIWFSQKMPYLTTINLPYPADYLDIDMVNKITCHKLVAENYKCI